MWNYILGKLRIGINWEVIWVGFFAIAFDFFAITSMLGIGRHPVFVFWTIVCGGLGIMTSLQFWSLLQTAFEVVPHWGIRFGKDNIFKLLAEDKFVPYVMEDGTVCRRVKVSKSGRWFKIKGRYYPIALIKGIDFGGSKSTLCESIVMIDGARIKDQSWIWTEKVKKALLEIIGDDDAYDDEDYKKAFRDVTGGDYQKLAMSNWDDVRYQWEQRLVELDYKQMNSRNRTRTLKNVLDPYKLRENFLERILSDEEIQTACIGIRKKRIKDFSTLLDKEGYEDEMYMLNSIKLLEKLGYPDNMKGEDFLFECIRDVKKPYCDDAIRALATFPKEKLAERIDIEIKKAHEDNDLLWAAGLISLAKFIDHEITLETEEIETQESVATESEAKGFTITG